MNMKLMGMCHFFESSYDGLEAKGSLYFDKFYGDIRVNSAQKFKILFQLGKDFLLPAVYNHHFDLV